MSRTALQPDQARPERVFRLTLSYDGSDFAGWQIQPQGRTVQHVLEDALCHVTNQENVRVIASGRTDAGVHALGQVVSVRLQTRLNAAILARAVNANLPADVRILAAEQASMDFHALRNATGKHYRYWLQHGPVQHVLRRSACAYLPEQLDTHAMRRGAKYLLGKQDFASFQAAGSPRKSTVRTIRRLELCDQIEDGAGCGPYRFLRIDIAADGFLYNMVRNIVGTLILVGRGRKPPNWVPEVLEAGDRTAAGPTAPANGLCLMSVDYEPEDHARLPIARP